MGWKKVEAPGAGWYDLPIIGEDLAKIGRIIRIYDTPCSPYFEVWVYALFQAVPTLFISLTKPELIDINIHKGHGRPRRGKKARFRAAAIYQGTLFQIPVPRWTVFRIYEQYQRIGWYLLVADALENFTINWLSMAYKDAGCTQIIPTYYRAEATHLLQGSSLTPASRRVTWTTVAANQVQLPFPGFQPIINGTYDVTWTATFTPWQVPADSQLPFGTHLVSDSGLVNPGENSTLAGGEQYSQGNGRLEVFGPPFPIFWIAGQWQDAEKFCYMDGSLSVDRVEDTELQPDP